MTGCLRTATAFAMCPPRNNAGSAAWGGTGEAMCQLSV